MKKTGWISLLLFGVAVLGTFSASSAWAACNTPSGACSCGDTVITNTVLRASDPVTRTVCTGPAALFVAGGVNLDISSAVIRCNGSSGFTVGLWIVGNGVTIDGGSGIIASCRRGIFGVTSNSTIEKVFVKNNFDGILLDANSNNNTLVRNLCHNNEHDGISVLGNGNLLDRNYCRGNGSDGIDVSGSFNSLNRNQTRNNVGDGIHFVGNSNTLNQNLASGNLGTGIDVDGSFNHFTHNQAQNNGRNGIFAPDFTNTTDFLNTATGNGGAFQCLIDTSTGTVC